MISDKEKESLLIFLDTIRECRDEKDLCMVIVPVIDNKVDVYKISFKAVQLAMQLESHMKDFKETIVNPISFKDEDIDNNDFKFFPTWRY
jgi:hypothetical protein